MLRTVLGSVVLLLVVSIWVNAEDKNKDKKDAKAKQKEATITKVDAKKGTVTLRMKDKEGKEQEKTFTLAEDVRMMDSTGKVVAIDVFRSGNDVLFIEAEGKLKEMQQHPKAKQGEKAKGSTEKKSGEK